MNYPAHSCPTVDPETLAPLVPDLATCGACGRSWCERCCPTPAALCPFCNGDGARGQASAIPPRQARELLR